jgi:oligopeptide/dipeptide ABC transporter ATP-binding protein
VQDPSSDKQASQWLLETVDLTKVFQSGRGTSGGSVRAVDRINLKVREGTTLGIVGESGCGKSTSGNLIVRLLNPTSGAILFDGEDISRARGSRLKQLRRSVQMVFQDPSSSLNPRMTIEQIVAEPLHIHRVGTRSERLERVGELLEAVGVPQSARSKMPSEFSGGQQQRITIARALALSPRLLVLDEPVSALDLSIQAQVLNLLADLQTEFGLTYILISHDLSVIRHVCDDVAVMYLGRIVEEGPRADVFDRPTHPYTNALVSAAPGIDGAAHRRRIVLTGDVPDPADVPVGCGFEPRCWLSADRCVVERPELVTTRAGSSRCACHFPINESIG